MMLHGFMFLFSIILLNAAFVAKHHIDSPAVLISISFFVFAFERISG